MITREFKLYLNAGGGVAPVINANQFDQDEEWIFTLLQSDGTVYTPSTGAIIGLKQDGTTILNAGTVNEDGQVVITETEQMTAVPGSNLFEILIDGNTHGTANFVVFVERRPGDIDNPSASDISLFQEAISAAGNVTQFQADISALQSGLSQETQTRQAQDTSLASQIAQEASTRSQQDAVLQAEIDQIIAPSGEAPSAAEVQNARIGVDGTTYDTLGNAIRGQVSDLKNALISNVSKKIKVEQGYWAIADGTATNSNNWCRTSNFADKEAVFVTTNIQMYILAFDAVSGAYVGTWNGTEFSTTYNVNSFVKEIVFKEWLDKYPNYSFKVDFRKNGESFTPTDVLGDLQIIDYNFSEIDFVESAILESDATGECRLNPYSFTRGTLTNGILYPSYKYRVSTKTIQSFDYDLTVVAKSGFRFSVFRFSDGTYSTETGWKTKYVIPANQEFKILIARQTDDTSETANIYEFVKGIYVESLSKFIDDAGFETALSGICKLNPIHFTNGTLTQGDLLPSYKYRVSMIEIKSYPYDVNIIAKTGFRLSINLYTNGTYTGYAGWTTNYTISKNQQFRIMIARTTDNTTEIADINEFVGNVYIKSLSLKKEESFETNGNFGNALTSNNRYIYHFGMEYVTERTETPPTIPAQSIYDVRNAKNLGFWCIECNVHKTSDGKYVVTHGVQGKLGHDFDDLNGNDAGEQNVIISQNTLSDLQANYRYRSSNPAYRVPITTLEDFLAECSRVNINVMQMYNDTTSMNIGINIMGGHRIWFYSAPRSVYSGAITNWRKLTTKAEIIADCESYGLPYVYSMGNPEAFSDSELKDIAETLHSMGYQLMTAYQTNNTMNKLASFGWDYFILGNNSFREPVIINGKRINFNQDGSVTWTTIEP